MEKFTLKLIIENMIVKKPGSFTNNGVSSETNRETSVIIPLLITVLFQIKTLVTCVK